MRADTSYMNVLRHVLRSGSDNLEVFGGSYEGGYRCQQVPEEIAELISWMSGLSRHFSCFLEVGSASGGTSRLLDDFLAFDEVFIIDDNAHIQAPLRPSVMPRAAEFIGSSLSPECSEQLKQWNRRFDLVLIDASHEYEHVKQDTTLVLPYCNNRCLVVFHDVFLPEYGVGRWTDELRQGQMAQLRHVHTIGSRLGLAVFEFVGINPHGGVN